jgi:hypothetical protein
MLVFGSAGPFEANASTPPATARTDERQTLTEDDPGLLAARPEQLIDADEGSRFCRTRPWSSSSTFIRYGSARRQPQPAPYRGKGETPAGRDSLPRRRVAPRSVVTVTSRHSPSSPQACDTAADRHRRRPARRRRETRKPAGCVGKAGAAMRLSFQQLDLGGACPGTVAVGQVSPATTAPRSMRRPWTKPSRAGRCRACTAMGNSRQARVDPAVAQREVINARHRRRRVW